MLHSGVRGGYCWIETNSNNTFRQLIHNQVIPLQCCCSLGSNGDKVISCWLALANLHTVATCERNIISAQNRMLLLWKVGLSPTVCAGKRNRVDNCTDAFMSPVQSGARSGAPWRDCPWRGFLSAVGLSLIYGGHHWLAGRAGGAQAPSLSQPQLKANYIFISLWSGWTRTDLWSRPETDMDPIPLSCRSGGDNNNNKRQECSKMYVMQQYEIKFNT